MTGAGVYVRTLIFHTAVIGKGSHLSKNPRLCSKEKSMFLTLVNVKLDLEVDCITCQSCKSQRGISIRVPLVRNSLPLPITCETWMNNAKRVFQRSEQTLKNYANVLSLHNRHRLQVIYIIDLYTSAI